jgi:hypothetical protein
VRFVIPDETIPADGVAIIVDLVNRATEESGGVGFEALDWR